MSDTAIALRFGVSNATVHKWRKTDFWQSEHERLGRLKAGAMVEHEQETRGKFRADLLRARDELKSNADTQIKVSTAMLKVSGQALSEALKNGGAMAAAKLSGDLARLVSSASIASRGARDTYQTVYAIEEILEALSNGKA